MKEDTDQVCNVNETEMRSGFIISLTDPNLK